MLAQHDSETYVDKKSNGMHSEENSLEDGNEKDIQANKYFHLQICRNLEISIYRPLLSLKIAQFIWFGAGASVQTFLSLFLKHRGITVQEISLMYMIIPTVQCAGTSLLSIFADKLGKFKPILIGNLILTAAIAVIMVNLPSARETNLHTQTFILNCQNQNISLPEFSECIEEGKIELSLCEILCSANRTSSCFEPNTCGRLLQEKDFSTFSNSSQELVVNCPNETSSISGYKSNCDDYWNSSCQLSCKVGDIPEDSERPLNRDVLVLVYTGVCLLFFLTWQNAYRFFDITVMALVKQHKADYGKERIFSVMGQVICPSLTGYIVYNTTSFDQEENYDTALYAYTVMCLLTAAVVYKIDIHGCGAGNKLWSKIIILLKNLDNLLFFFVLHIIGMSWGFLIIFRYWYLEGLKMEAYQIGLIETTYNLCGLPFMFFSHWLIKRIGITNIFTLALVGYAVTYLGYSFLHVPWPAFILELTSVFSYHLMWVAAMYYCQIISPTGLVASVNALAGSIHFTIGRVLGSVIGGTIMSKFGGRIAFRVLAAVNIISAILYLTFRNIRKRQRNKS